MPNIEGAAKRMRQAERARQRNIAVRSRIKNVRRQLLEMTAVAESGKLDTAVYRKYCSLLDKAAKIGVIKKNTAVRRKRRATERIRRQAAAPAPKA